MTLIRLETLNMNVISCLSVIVLLIRVSTVQGTGDYIVENNTPNVKEGCGYELLAERIAALEHDNAKLKSKLEAVTKQRYRRQTSFPSDIGFTAIISHHLSSLSARSPIVFDSLISNIGSGYDVQTGTFIAPVPGTYQFFTTIMSENSNDYIETEIVKNGSQLVELYSGGSTGHDSSSNMVIVYLQKGDHVWVRVHGANSNTFKIHGGFSSFSGYLLRMDEDALDIFG